jgi:hypothetical protein
LKPPWNHEEHLSAMPHDGRSNSSAITSISLHSLRDSDSIIINWSVKIWAAWKHDMVINKSPEVPQRRWRWILQVGQTWALPRPPPHRSMSQGSWPTCHRFCGSRVSANPNSTRHFHNRYTGSDGFIQEIRSLSLILQAAPLSLFSRRMCKVSIIFQCSSF